MKIKMMVLGILLLLAPLSAYAGEQSMIDTEPVEAFTLTIEALLPGTTDDVFEAITGDVSGWWVHSETETPYQLTVDSYPGGKFREIWDESGYGVQHATVTKADYGSVLQYDGPYILDPDVLKMTTTWSLNDMDDNQTSVHIIVYGLCPTGIGVPEKLEHKWDYLLNVKLKEFLMQNETPNSGPRESLPISTEETSDPTFQFTIEAEITGTPNEVFAAATGDISQWWDHSFSEKPYSLTVDPVPGGAFLEIFDEEGNGARHAVVTAADRGKLLRYEGPLGLAGNALFMVTTWSFAEISANSTLVTVEVHGTGEVLEGWPEVIEGVWDHFLNDGLMAFCEAGHE